MNPSSETLQEWLISGSLQLALLVCLVLVLTLACRKCSARLRHGLWLLVVLKVFLPPGLAAPWAIGNLPLTFMPYVAQAISFSPDQTRAAEAAPLPPTPNSEATADISPSPSRTGGLLVQNLPWLWVAGALLYLLTVAFPYAILMRRLGRSTLVDEGPLAVTYQSLALHVEARRTPPRLLLSSEISSPFLVGFLRPAVVLPQSYASELTPSQMEHVLLHELTHWRRRDVLVGWMQVVAQALFWFHPLLWLANGRLGEEREAACDEEVITYREGTARCYADTLLQVLLISRGRSSAVPGFLGIFERSTRIQKRLEQIMMQEQKAHRFGWLGYSAILATAVMLLPMGRTGRAAADTPTPQPALRTAPNNAVAEPAEALQAAKPPTIISLSPTPGSTNVDPATAAITVTFDQDMSSGMSWTGGGPEFPAPQEGKKPVWQDKRTCVFPVKLEAGKFYRLGINSTSYQNFRSVEGVPAQPTSIYFSTRGAAPEVHARAGKPTIVSMDPPNGAVGVSPTTGEIRVVFNVPMAGGFSWTGGGENFPEIPAGQVPSWSSDRKTCLLPVKLKPNWNYRLGLNSVSYKNFASEAGVPLDPVEYRFSTAK